MKKYVLVFLFLLSAGWVMGQKTSRVILVSSSTLESVKGVNGKSILKVHNGVFKQDYSTLRSDSAYFYPDKNAVDAFGHVNINQGDTLNIYSDKLNYNGNTKLAILTDNVKMIDKDAILTTNYLTYNTATRIAIYTGGGKLVNKDNKLVSKNGYYFAFTRDSYFRYDVVCTTPDALIKTDTLRYNSGSRIAYFYGPTHIYGSKDKDTLYTEDGTYNTINEQARFGKKNLYSQGTKTLKGDSLFYDRLKGYGRAIKHITFTDNEQKTTIKGDLGEFYKADDRAVVTQNAYMVFVTDEKDTTKTNSANVEPAAPPNTIPINKKLAALNKADAVKKLPLKPDSLSKRLTMQGVIDSVVKKPAIKNSKVNKKLTLQGVIDSVIKKPAVKTQTGAAKSNHTAAKNKIANTAINKADSLTAMADSAGHIKHDSLFMAADTLETRILTFKALKLLRQQRWNASHRDTSIKVVKSVVLTKPLKFIPMRAPALPVDTSLYHAEFFGKPRSRIRKPAKPVDLKKLAADSIKRKRIADSLELIADHGLVDTSRVRIISGHHHAKIYKSDLQAVADSMFYSYSDSTIRMYKNPMIWTQGSQLSGDTINLQMKNRKLDNMDMFPSAFVVNIGKNDSVHFNQMGGKKMHGTFKDNKLSTIMVTGNAETIAYKRDSATNKVTDMERSVSGRIGVIFKNGEIVKGGYYTKPEIHVFPLSKVKEEDKILKGFIWKPKDRPVSKEAVIYSYKPPALKKPVVITGKPVKGTMPVKTLKAEAGKKPRGKTTAKPAAINRPVLKQPADTALKPKPDTLKLKDTSLKQPDTLKAHSGKKK